VEINERVLFVQYGCLNFHAKRGRGPKLSIAIKNKWPSGSMKSWFYYRIQCLRSSEGGKSVHALRSRMSALDYTMEPKVKCLDKNASDDSFVRAAATIGGHDAVEEFLACKMYPLASCFSFWDVAIGMTPVLKVRTPLPLFPVEAVPTENACYVLAGIETNTVRILASSGLKEYDAL
jgi:hypothetical protein